MDVTHNCQLINAQIAKFMGPTWGPPGSCRPQMGPMLAPWTLPPTNVGPMNLATYLATYQGGLTYAISTASMAYSAAVRDRLVGSMTHAFHWWYCRSPVNSPHKGQWRGAWMFSLMCAWNSWVYNRYTCDLRHHSTHYDVTVISKSCLSLFLCKRCLLFGQRPYICHHGIHDL